MATLSELDKDMGYVGKPSTTQDPDMPSFRDVKNEVSSTTSRIPNTSAGQTGNRVRQYIKKLSSDASSSSPLDAIKDFGEAGLTLASGVVAPLAGVAVGAGTGVANTINRALGRDTQESAAEAQKQIKDALTYTPSPTNPVTNAIGSAVEWTGLPRALKSAGDFVTGATGEEFLGQSTTDMLPFAAGPVARAGTRVVGSTAGAGANVLDKVAARLPLSRAIGTDPLTNVATGLVLSQIPGTATAGGALSLLGIGRLTLRGVEKGANSLSGKTSTAGTVAGSLDDVKPVTLVDDAAQPVITKADGSIIPSKADTFAMSDAAAIQRVDAIRANNARLGLPESTVPIAQQYETAIAASRAKRNYPEADFNQPQYNRPISALTAVNPVQPGAPVGQIQSLTQNIPNSVVGPATTAVSNQQPPVSNQPVKPLTLEDLDKDMGYTPPKSSTKPLTLEDLDRDMGYTPGPRSQSNTNLMPSIAATASRLGIKPEHLAAVISYETGGRMSTSIVGGAGNRHVGLIQFGPTEQRQYGARAGQSFEEQLMAVERYLKDRGLKPGSGISEIYRTVNGGNPNAGLNLSDGNGTIASHIQKIQREHLPKFS